MIGERPDRIEIDAAEVLRTYICRRRSHEGRYWFAFTGPGGRISVSSRSCAGDLGAGAETSTLTVGSASPTDPGNPPRLVIRNFETNRPASPRD
jgi:hypothetical protein